MSSHLLTPTEKVVLGLGIQYIPLSKTTPTSIFPLLQDSIKSLQRNLRIAFTFGNSPYKKPVIPKNTTKVLWHPDTLRIDPILTSYINKTTLSCMNALQQSRSLYRTNDHILERTLTRLSKNVNITIKPSDKNLGLTILDTSDYKLMCMVHLNDTKTYTRQTTQYFPNSSYAKLKRLLIKHKLLYDPSKFSLTAINVLSDLAISLFQLQNHISLRLAVFYVLPKIHKNKYPLPSRLIVSSSSTATYHASVYLDRTLQPILKTLYTVCQSSHSIILDLSTLKIKSNSIILCADITALYPNIPIIKGIEIVRKVLFTLDAFPKDKIDFLMALLHWILTENYISFNNETYHQEQGTAMGTPCAVSYANIFLYGIEHEILREMTLTYSYYKRYIDDVFSIMDSTEIATVFIGKFNAVIDSITFEAVTIGRSGIMLDLDLQLISSTTSDSSDTITHKLFQKERNIYQYIPVQSEHSPSVLSNFVIQETRRYNLCCTDPADFDDIILAFRQRLLDRGYPPTILQEALLKLPTRSSQLDIIRRRSLISPDAPRRKRQPILVRCATPRFHPPVPWQRLFKLPSSITTDPVYRRAYDSDDIIIGSRNDRSIGSYLVKSKFKDPNKL